MLRMAGRRRMFERGARADAVYLTFDDGPHPDHTPRLLDALAKREVKGTFFVVGEACERHPKIAQRIADEGHVLANHTYYHRLPRDVTAADLRDEVERTRIVIRDITGIDSKLFRPPYGELTLGKILTLWRHGYTIALWNLDPRDYRYQADEVATWLRLNPPQGGDIVLLHDNHSVAHEVVPKLLDLMKARLLEASRIDCQ